MCGIPAQNGAWAFIHGQSDVDNVIGGKVPKIAVKAVFPGKNAIFLQAAGHRPRL